MALGYILQFILQMNSKCIHCRLAGDFGFDPLNLGAEPEALRWCVVTS